MSSKNKKSRASKSPNPSQESNKDQKEKDEDEENFKLLRKFHSHYIKAHEKGGDYPDPIDPIRLWKFVLKIAASSPNQLYAQAFPFISFYNSIVPEFSENNPNFISEQIQELKDPKNAQSAVISIKPFIRVLPFLEMESIFEVLEISVDIVAQNLKAHPNQIPQTFVSTFDDVVVEDLNLDTYKGLVEYFKEKLDSDQKAPVLIIFAYFALDFVKIDDHLDQFVKQTIMDALNSDETIIVIAGFSLLTEYSSHFQFEPDSAPPTDFLIDAIFPNLISKNDSISRAAHEAAEAMIKCRIFQEDYAMDQILAMFDQYQSSNIDDFFSLLHVIIYPVNDYQEIDYNPDMKKLIPIRTFVLDKLQNSPEPIVKAHCINVISDLMSIKLSFVQKSFQLAFDESKNLITRKKTNTYYLISSFLEGMYEKYEKYRPEIVKFVPTLCEVLSKDKPLNKRQKLNLGIDISMICRQAKKPPPPVIIDLAKASISSKVLSEVMQSCCIVIHSVMALNQKAATAIFDKLSQHVQSSIHSSDRKTLNFMVKTMRVILKKNPINTPSSKMLFEIIIQNPQLLIEENGMNLTSNEFAKYIGVMMKLYPNIAQFVFPRFGDLVSQKWIPPPAFFIPLIASIKTGKVPDEEIEKLCIDVIPSILKKKEVREIPKTASIAIETLRVVFLTKKELIGPIDEKIRLVSSFLADIDLDEQEDPQIQNLLDIAPDACNFVLEVYATVPKIDVNEDLLITIFKLLPFPSEVKCNQFILKNIIKLVNNEKYARWKIKSCRVFAAYLLLDKKDLDELKFDPKVINQIKAILKKIANENNENFDKILKYFKNKNRDTPKLREIIQ